MLPNLFVTRVVPDLHLSLQVRSISSLYRWIVRAPLEQGTSLKMYCKFNGICKSVVYCSLPTFCGMFVHWCPFSWLVRYGMQINRRPMCLLFLVPCKSNSEWNKWLWTYWRSLWFGLILFTRNKYWILYFLFRFYEKYLACRQVTSVEGIVQGIS